MSEIRTGPTQSIACHQCDLLQQLPALEPGHRARCIRCQATLARNGRFGTQHNLALALAGLILLWPAFTLPMLTMEVLGQRNSSNLLDSITITWGADYPLVALSIALFCLLVPSLLLGLLFCLQLPLPWPSLRRQLLILLHHLRQWSMLDIYLIGLLVSIVKVRDVAGFSLGPGLLSFVLLMLVLLVALHDFTPETHWQTLERRP